MRTSCLDSSCTTLTKAPPAESLAVCLYIKEVLIALTWSRIIAVVLLTDPRRPSASRPPA